MKIFVYGTLKRGHELHDALMDQRFLGHARTHPLYRMYSLGSYPGLVLAEPDNGLEVEGEVWDVHERCVMELDAIEGVDEGEYARVSIPLHPPFDAARVEGYLYLGDVTGLGEVGARW